MIINSDNADVFGIVVVVVTIVAQFTSILVTSWNSQHKTSPRIPRQRNTMNNLRTLYGSRFKQAYCMSWKSFKKLNNIIQPHIQSHHECNSGPNGPIPSEICLAVALQYFAGASMVDIMISHGLSYAECYQSVWMIVDIINKIPEFRDLTYPKSHDEQKVIAAGFAAKSECFFQKCCGCINGILIWIEKPCSSACKAAGVDAGKFFCGRKHKYGLNMQAACDSRHRFLDVSIMHPGYASDFLAFATINYLLNL